MGILEAEMRRLLGWVNPQKLAAIQSIKCDQDRNRKLTELVQRYGSLRLEDERETYSMACIGQRVWIHLPGDYRMELYEGEVVSIEVRDGELVAKLKDARWPDLIEFDPRITMPHYYRARKTDGTHRTG